MKEQQTPKRMLVGNYRVLDLTDEKGYLCGKTLGDLGADVIKIEQPDGDSGRRIGPFYKDIIDPNKSLFWFAFNTSKRGITLNIETTDGQEILKKLVEKADILVESFPAGYMENLGLDYKQLSKINPQLIMVSITPFGQTGPYRDYKAPDIVGQALTGILCLTGDEDRPPVWSGFPEAYSFAGIDGAIGAMAAIHYRYLNGTGQHIDISMQRSLFPTTYYALPFWTANRIIPPRQGAIRVRPQTNVIYRQHWPCKDGYVTFFFWGGRGVGERSNGAITKWVDSEGIEREFLKSMDWPNFDFDKLDQEMMDQMEKPITELFKRYTKQELYREAIKRRILLYPMATAKDTAESEQLAVRHYWAEIKHPELNTTITYPDLMFKDENAENLSQVWRRAPLIGEHNEEIYEKEMGFSKEEMNTLIGGGVI